LTARRNAKTRNAKTLSFPKNTKNLILNILLDGPKSVGEIATNLKIQKNAIRSHLETMEKEEVVKSYFKAEKLGRPKKVYEITPTGRELFPRKYDAILSLLIQKVEDNQGHEYVKKIMMSIADTMASEISEKISKGSTSANLRKSLNILNAWSNDIGFMSSLHEEDDGSYSIISHNCIVHKAAVAHQDAICQGFHNTLIQKALGGIMKPTVQLKECIALGDNYSRHSIAK
jgi:DeoR family transcriptional regulator, suf operon transcriptional repressor